MPRAAAVGSAGRHTPLSESGLYPLRAGDLFVALAGYLLAARISQPAVVGEILVGLVIGPSVLGWITYTVDGRQHVSILAGFFGGPTALGAPAARFGWVGREQPRRLVTFVLDGKGRLPRPPLRAQARPLEAPEFVIDPKKVERGAKTFGANCVNCHGIDAVAGGAAPDLRASPIPLSHEAFDEIVRQGSLAIRGMPRFDWIDGEDLDAMRHYLRRRARDALEQAADAARAEAPRR